MNPFVLFVIGVTSVCGGAWMVYHPAGPIVAGAFLIFIAVKSMSSGQK